MVLTGTRPPERIWLSNTIDTGHTETGAHSLLNEIDRNIPHFYHQLIIDDVFYTIIFGDMI